MSVLQSLKLPTDSAEDVKKLSFTELFTSNGDIIHLPHCDYFQSEFIYGYNHIIK
jgi:hypothetical protein